MTQLIGEEYKMKKRLSVIGMVTLLLAFGLSGCVEQETSGNIIDEVELVSYSVETQKWEGVNNSYSYEKIGNGFIHSEDAYRYVITGTLKNIAGEVIDNIRIIANFYDSNSKMIGTLYDLINSDLPNAHTADFNINVYKSVNYFEKIDGVKFEFEVP